MCKSPRHPIYYIVYSYIRLYSIVACMLACVIPPATMMSMTGVLVLTLLRAQLTASCSMHVVDGKACTNAAKVRILGRPSANSSDDCCAACAAMAACGAWTFHASSRGGSGSCLVANHASSPGQIHGATCGTKGILPPPLPPAPPGPPHPPLPPLPKPPAGLQVVSLHLQQHLIMSDDTGFLRDPSSPIQAPGGVWHAWAVWVDPKFGQEGWSGKLKHFYSTKLAR